MAQTVKSADGWKVTVEKPFIRAKHRNYGDLVVNVEMMGALEAMRMIAFKMDEMEVMGDRRMGKPR